MTRLEWQQLAERWLVDAKRLLDDHRWSAAYYLAGYAVECGLKSCVLVRVAATPEVIFGDKKFSEKCWTHSILDLVKMANLEGARATDAAANATLGKNWMIAKDWSEKARYTTTSHQKAKKVLRRDHGSCERGDAMDQGPLVIDQVDAGARFLGQFQKYMSVHAAFWLKETEGGEWNLYVASDQITDDNFDVAYGEVLRIAGVLRDPFFDPFQVKLIGVDDSLAKAALDIQRRYPGRIPTRFHGKVFGDIAVEEVYIYPSPIPVPAA